MTRARRGRRRRVWSAFFLALLLSGVCVFSARSPDEPPSARSAAGPDPPEGSESLVAARPASPAGSPEAGRHVEPDAELEVLVLAEGDLVPVSGARLHLSGLGLESPREVYTDARGVVRVPGPAWGDVSAPGFATTQFHLGGRLGRHELVLRRAALLCVDAGALGPLASAPMDQVTLVLTSVLGEVGMAFDAARHAWCVELPPTERYRLSACGPELCAESAWVGPGPAPPVIPWEVEPRVTQGQVIDDERRFEEVLVEVFHGAGRRVVSLDLEGRFRLARPTHARSLRVRASRGELHAEATVAEGPVVLRLQTPRGLRGRVVQTELCRPPVRLSIDSRPVVETNAQGEFEVDVPPSAQDAGSVTHHVDLEGGPSCPRAWTLCAEPCEVALEGLAVVGSVALRAGREPSAVVISFRDQTRTTQTSGPIRAVFLTERQWLRDLDPNGSVVVELAHQRIRPILTRLDDTTWAFGELVFDAARVLDVTSVDDRGWPLAGTRVACVEESPRCVGCGTEMGSSCVSRADGRCQLSCGANTQVVATPLDEAAFARAAAQVAEAHVLVLRSPRLGRVQGRCLASPDTIAGTTLTLYGPNEVPVASAVCGDGTFELAGLPAGEYSLEELPSGRHARVSVVPGTVTNVALVGGPRGSSAERAGP